MLSATNSVTDVKTKLISTYADLGLASDNAYTTLITSVATEAKLLDIVPVIGTSTYGIIEAKDKVSLTTDEENVYWAEVCYIAYRLLKAVGQQQNQGDGGAGSSLQVEGYSRGGGSGFSGDGKGRAAAYLGNQARRHLAAAGYPAFAMTRGDSYLAEDPTRMRIL